MAAESPDQQIHAQLSGVTRIYPGAAGTKPVHALGPVDRSALLPVCGRLEQSDGTAWMAMYCLDLLEIALTLARREAVYEDVATKFFEHFALIAQAMNEKGLWEDGEGFYYDVLRLAGGERVPLRVRSMVGLIPLFATQTLGRGTLEALPDFARRFHWFLRFKPAAAHCASRSCEPVLMNQPP